jgi:hypothetical protein
MSSRDQRIKVLEMHGYSKVELLEGDTLEEVWQKLGEKIGEGEL